MVGFGVLFKLDADLILLVAELLLFFVIVILSNSPTPVATSP